LKVKTCILILIFVVSGNNVFARTKIIKDVPYINQVEDVDESMILGHNACAATVSVMLLTYYGILPKHEIFPGYYIYSPYIGFTDKEGNDYSQDFAYDFDGIGSRKNKVYGAHGYIVGKYEGSWQAEVGNVIKYLENNGLEGVENTSENMFEKIRRDIDKGQPLIARAKIDQNGHYLLVVGYDDEKNEIIVHDPYGNANIDWFNTKAGGKYVSYPMDNNLASWVYVKIESILEIKTKK
jgi:hypothetical protein